MKRCHNFQKRFNDLIHGRYRLNQASMDLYEVHVLAAGQ